jgi:hypothetical protein
MTEPFSATGLGKHREGFVAELTPEGAESWAGNYQPGLGGISDIFAFPDGRSAVVVAGGQGYIVDSETRVLRATLGAALQWAAERDGWLLFHDGFGFFGFGNSGQQWISQRLSWDGIRNVSVEADRIMGEAWDPSDLWLPFEVELATGEVTGGSVPEEFARRML